MSIKATTKTTDYDFQRRMILAMATAMADKKRSDELLFVQFAALAKSAGVKIPAD